jgi:hypothetical protein
MRGSYHLTRSTYLGSPLAVLRVDFGLQIAMSEQKIARAVEECLTLMDASADAPLIAELEYVSELQSDDRWSDDEIRAVQNWVRKAVESRGP